MSKTSQIHYVQLCLFPDWPSSSCLRLRPEPERAALENDSSVKLPPKEGPAQTVPVYQLGLLSQEA
jgi:hypothetical protein